MDKMTDEYTKLKVELFVGCVTWIRNKNEGKFGKAITSCLIKGNICKALACLAFLCSSLEFMIINMYQIKMFVYHK